MRYCSVCSGIEAATVAWAPLGWEPIWFAEIDTFACAVLAHHYPTVPNLGDFTKIGAEHGPIDLLVGGTPCQSFSVAGKRAGLDDPRGNLTLEYLALAGRLRSPWLVWENVPGVLSIDEGRTFGTFLGLLGDLGYGWAYRILDAQYFGVPQRRRRVFVVGHRGDWRRAAAVLFERASLSGDPPPSREARQNATAPVGACATYDRGDGLDNLIAGTMDGSMDRRRGAGQSPATLVTCTLRSEGADASEDGTGRGVPLVFTCKDHGADAGVIAPTLRAMTHDKARQNGGGQVAVACYDDPRRFDAKGIHGGGEHGDLHPPLSTVNCQQITRIDTVVRRLTPRECERLQGLPDDYTLVSYRGKPAADGPRYRAIGNSFAVPVVRWIGQRIQEVMAL